MKNPFIIAPLAKLQARSLTSLFDLPHLTMPHHTTWSRILGEALDINQLEAEIADFFVKQLTSQVPARDSPGDGNSPGRVGHREPTALSA